MNNGILDKFSLPKNTTLIVGHIPTITDDLGSANLTTYQTGHSQERASQLATADFLIGQHFEDQTEIVRDEDGKPHLLDNHQHISISHTGEYMAMILSDQPVAVDIEIRGRSIDKIFNRFTRESEFEVIDQTVDKDSLLALWSIKECLFKITPHTGILFRENLLLNNCSWKGNALKSECSVVHSKLHKDFVVNSFIFEPLVVSYIIEDEV